MKNRIKILLISTIINKNLKRAIEDVRNYCDVRLICAHEIHYFDKGEIQRLVDWADLILLDMRGDPGILNEIDLKEKDLICLVGGGTLLARAKLGKFRMPAKVASSFISDPASLKRRLKVSRKLWKRLEKSSPLEFSGMPGTMLERSDTGQTEDMKITGTCSCTYAEQREWI